jgi:hypothetical protein
MAQQGGAKLAKAEGTPALDFSAIRTLLDDTQNPMEPQSSGVNFGRGAGESVLPASLRSDERLIENKAIINKYGSALLAAGQEPDAPDSYKQFLNFVIKEMQ